VQERNGVASAAVRPSARTNTGAGAGARTYTVRQYGLDHREGDRLKEGREVPLASRVSQALSQKGVLCDDDCNSPFQNRAARRQFLTVGDVKMFED
jgi:hypothetical protein